MKYSNTEKPNVELQYMPAYLHFIIGSAARLSTACDRDGIRKRGHPRQENQSIELKKFDFRYNRNGGEVLELDHLVRLPLRLSLSFSFSQLGRPLQSRILPRYRRNRPQQSAHRSWCIDGHRAAVQALHIAGGRCQAFRFQSRLSFRWFPFLPLRRGSQIQSLDSRLCMLHLSCMIPRA